MNPFIRIGIAIIFGVLCGKAMNKLKVPSVAGYIIAGLILGVSGFNLLNADAISQFSSISDFALCIIAFNIGSELELSVVKKLGRSIFVIALCEALGAFFFVTLISYALTQKPEVALILGSVSAATAPAATVMVLREYGAKGPLASTLMGVVAVDDAICLIIYAMAASVAKVFVNHDVITLNKVLFLPLEEIIVSIVVGCLMGIVLTYLLRLSKKDMEMLPFIIGALLLMDGMATTFHLSPLLSAMSLGIIVANLSSKKHKAFSLIENFSPPIIAAFFILAGARLNIFYIPQIGLLGIAYFLFRIIGKVSGASLGATISKAPKVVKQYIGFGLLSQVGVAVGLAITVSREFPGTDLGTLVVTILLATTIATEIIGPMMTKYAITKAHETNI
ncbi:cation:proton antiporter [Fusibacter paucivorans]|uniref:Cation:proton antiporter n=1 Tax=Fusibacter paucivorans TaxID=76009 RepID=A0ABS5PQZ3_9FIRM|nr:cation:proton antiporter [Fusibacter paucivorans]MBS7527555.1 cation:proton antiporter [Fusibacter paucivorans]